MHLLAAEGSPVALELLPLITTIVVFCVAFLILRQSVWPRITQGLDDRNNKIREEIKAAEDAREQAKAAQAEYEASLLTARKEASDMIAKAKNDAKAAAEELRKRNEVELAELKRRANADIEAAKQAAITDLHSEASALAAAIAGKILQREITVEDQQRLVQESLSELTTAS